MALTVHIDKELCISSGRCVADAPEAFSFDTDELGQPDPAAGELDPARLASIARNCPGGAIIVTAENGSRFAP